MEWLQSQWMRLVERIMDEMTWIVIGQGVLKILAIFLLAFLLIRIGKSVIRNVFKVRTRYPLKLAEKRENTLVKLLENILSYVVYFIALMMVLQVFTIDVRAMLAGAGIVGLAVGFGAQNLVRDVITGFFIIFENQFSVGDFIRTGNFEGTVEEIGLRTTKIKSWTGEIHILPNGSIMEVTNFSVSNSLAVVDVGVSYDENIPVVEQVLEDLLKELPEKYPEMVGLPELLGVQTLGSSDVVLRVTAEVLPMEHWSMARKLRKEIKLRFDEEGIEIPFPRLVMYQREEENQMEKPSMSTENGGYQDGKE